MSVIKPRARGKHVIDHRTRLDQENHETLYAYAAFVDEEPDYVINQLVETVLAKDKEFLAWRADGMCPSSHSDWPRTSTIVRPDDSASFGSSITVVPRRRLAAIQC